METNETKVCSKCGETKDISKYQFEKFRNKYRAMCKACINATSRANPRKYQDRKDYTKAYQEKHPDVMAYHTLNRRAKIKGFTDTLDKVTFCAWYAQEPKVCHYCGDTPTPCKFNNYSKRLEIDRKDNTVGYSVDNLVLACTKCNLAKAHFWTYEVFKKYIGPAIKAAREEVASKMV